MAIPRIRCRTISVQHQCIYLLNYARNTLVSYPSTDKTRIHSRCFILVFITSRKKQCRNNPQKKIPENALGACGNDIFVLYLHPQTAPRELSSAGSERLPYKQRVGGSNPSAPTTPTINDLRKRESFFVGMLRCPLCCRRSGPRSCGETCRADEKKADRYAIRLAGFHVPPPHGAQCAT